MDDAVVQTELLAGEQLFVERRDGARTSRLVLAREWETATSVHHAAVRVVVALLSRRKT